MRTVLVITTAWVAIAGCSSTTTTTTTPTPTGTPASAGSSSGQSATKSTVSTRAGPSPLPLTANGLLKGTAKPTFPAGTPGKIDVVGVGPLDVNPSGDGTLPIAVRNNTNSGVAHIDISATARNSAHKVIATGTNQGVQPAQLHPGELGLSYIYFQVGTAVPKAGATYTFSVASMPADSSSYNTASVKVTEANASAGSIVGTGANTTGKLLQGPYKVDIFCFNGPHFAFVRSAFTNENNDLQPGGAVSFTVNLDGAACPTFLAGISGYYA
jgi:hypothetical protein